MTIVFFPILTIIIIYGCTYSTMYLYSRQLKSVVLTLNNWRFKFIAIDNALPSIDRVHSNALWQPSYSITRIEQMYTLYVQWYRALRQIITFENYHVTILSYAYTRCKRDWWYHHRRRRRSCTYGRFPRNFRIRSHSILHP